MQNALQRCSSARENSEWGSSFCRSTGRITKSSITRQDFINHRTFRHTQAYTHTAAAATYFFVICLSCWLQILTVVVSGGPASIIRRYAVKFILLIGPWPRRAQRAGLQLLNTALDLHLPLKRLVKEDSEEQGSKGDELGLGTGFWNVPETDCNDGTYSIQWLNPMNPIKF